jgi:hypothetical protein
MKNPYSLKPRLERAVVEAGCVKPGEPVQAVFPGMTVGMWKLDFGMTFTRSQARRTHAHGPEYGRIVIFTPERVLVFAANLSTNWPPMPISPHHLIAELPRDTQFSPVSGMTLPVITIPAGNGRAPEKVHLLQTRRGQIRKQITAVAGNGTATAAAALHPRRERPRAGLRLTLATGVFSVAGQGTWPIAEVRRAY